MIVDLNYQRLAHSLLWYLIMLTGISDRVESWQLHVPCASSQHGGCVPRARKQKLESARCGGF